MDCCATKLLQNFPTRTEKVCWKNSLLQRSRSIELIYIAGQTPADDNYQPLHSGDLRAQYAAVLDGLTLQLKAAGATWDDVVFRRMYALDVPAFLKVLNDRTLPLPWDVNRPSPSTLIGVTALANPGFLIEVEIMAVVAA